MPADPWSLYALMKRARLFEEAVALLWNEGRISGEMHLGTGEEAIVAGVVAQLEPHDAMALDHRGTPPLVMRGVDPVAILRELLGRPDGLCGGRGGHMHLFSRDHLAASSGIVGAAGPAACGFALAGRRLRPGSIAVAFFGEGAMNQGMLLEALNLAAAWRLPVLFVCKDDRWSITTESDAVTGGDLRARAAGFGVPYLGVDGLDAAEVWRTAEGAIARARAGEGPSFLHASCVHLEAHFLGYQLLRAVRKPAAELPRIAAPLARSFLRGGGASPSQRWRGVGRIAASFLDTVRDPRRSRENDPLVRARRALDGDPERLRTLDGGLEREMADVLRTALEGGGP